VLRETADLSIPLTSPSLTTFERDYQIGNTFKGLMQKIFKKGGKVLESKK